MTTRNKKWIAALAFSAMVILFLAASQEFVAAAIAAVTARPAQAYLPTHLTVSGRADVKRTGTPSKISINSIALKASIEKVALTPRGALDVPKDPLRAGWYELGPRPGEAGTAVIDGHVDWFHGATGVFKDLRKVKKGDVVTITDDRGVESLFKVREIRVYHPAADATAVFTAADSKSHLNLITCNGAWDPKTRQYSERLVVFTDKITNENVL